MIWIGPFAVEMLTGPAVSSPRILRFEGIAVAPIVNESYVPGVTQTTEFGSVAALIAAWMVANAPLPPTFLTLPGVAALYGVVDPRRDGTRRPPLITRIGVEDGWFAASGESTTP